MENYNKSVLSNGLRVVSMYMPHVRTVTSGIWVGSGARQESDATHGAAHFIEHMLFKGTARRTARQLSEEVEEFGGSFNAYTAKEKTCYYIRLLDNHADLAIDVLSDILLNSRFAENDIQREKQVICEEINSSEDAPEDLVYDMHMAAVWPQHALGRTILGSADSIIGFERADLLDFWRRQYLAGNMLLVMAGNIEHERAVALAEHYLAVVPAGVIAAEQSNPQVGSAITVRAKELEQVQFCLGGNGLKTFDDNMYALHVLNNVFGGGPASRLFQSVREEHGLAYSIYSAPTSYSDSGTVIVHGAVRPENFTAVCGLVLDEVRSICRNGVGEQELHRAKEQIKCSLLMGLESSGSVMSRTGNIEMALGRYLPIAEAIAKIEKVSLQDVAQMAEYVFDNRYFSLTALGAVDEKAVADMGFN